MRQFVDDALLRQAHEHALQYLKALPDRFVGAPATREEMLAILKTPLSKDGEDGGRVLDALIKGSERGTMGTPSPRFFGFVIGGSLPVALAADWITSAWDQNAGIFVGSPVASVAEEVAREWLLDLFDLPRTASLGFVTGCQMANCTGLAAARNAVLHRVGYDVETQGLRNAPPINIVIGAEAHITIHASLKILGFGTAGSHQVETDGQGRMRADALRKTLEPLKGPTIICAQAGNVNTGAVDPLREIAGLARERNAWMHVDGAFGLWARASKDRRALLDGVELADSWATDAHKWLNVPYDNGIVIVRDAEAHRASMNVMADYIEHTEGPERDPFDWVPEFSRRARGITVYAALRTLGRAGVESLVDRLCARARQIADLLRNRPKVRVLNDVVLNQVLVRFGDDDEFTRKVISRVQEDGTCWLAGTVWQGKAAMRISVSNWATNEDDIARSADAILRCMS